MVTQQVILTTTVTALAAITQHRFVDGGGNPCTAGRIALGVTEIDADEGDAVPLNVLGIIAVEAGAAIEAGATIQSDANGCAVPKTSSNAVNGIALDAASAAGEIIRILRGV